MKIASSKLNDKLIFLTAGGTGGHVYPAEALAEELKRRGFDLALVTDARGKNNYKGTLGAIPNYAVKAGALVGKSPWFKLMSLCKVGIGVLQSIALLLKHKPCCVVGFGGYASFPCCVAAVLLGIKLVLHEQNSVMSRTNRLLSKYAALVAQSFRKVKYAPTNVKNIVTGMPIRAAIADLYNQPYPMPENGNFQLLILGGSQGCRVFSDVLPSAIAELDSDICSKMSIVQQCREDDVEVLEHGYKGLPCKVKIAHFFDNMPELYAKSQLIISRSGASSVAEIAAVGIPSILVPLPTSADNHQMSNARELTDVEGGILMEQKDFAATEVSRLLTDLIQNPQKLKQMAENAKKAAITDAAVRLADAIQNEVINQKAEKANA